MVTRCLVVKNGTVGYIGSVPEIQLLFDVQPLIN